MLIESKNSNLKRAIECDTRVIQYADLDHEDFQIAEPTIYEIHWDGVKFEFLVCHKPGNKQAAVFGTGDVGDSKTKYQFPIFSCGRWAKDLLCNGIWYFDPTVYLGDATLCWYYGTNKRWYLKDIAQIIQTILKKWNISMADTVFSGSSGGGFSSILLATMLKGKAAVMNPQFIASNYHRHLVERLKLTVLEPGEELIDERVSAVSLFRQTNHFPQIYVKQNIKAANDLETQLLPFLQKAQQLQFDCKERIHVEFYNAEGGHNAMPTQEETLCWIYHILEMPLLDMPAVKTTGYFVSNGKLYFYLDTGKKIRLDKDEKVDFSELSEYKYCFQLIADGRPIADLKVIESTNWTAEPVCAFNIPKDGTYMIKYFIDDGKNCERYYARNIRIVNGSTNFLVTSETVEFIEDLEQRLNNTKKDGTVSVSKKEIKKIIFSIDTESGCGDPYRIHGNLQKYGIQGNWGVSYIMDAFEKRNMRAVFFVNVYEHASYTPEYENYIADLCAEIEARGHEVALHSHQSNLPFYARPIYDYDLDQQTEIIRYGCEFIKKATGKAPVSFRGGAYHVDENTFLALERNGIKVESSSFYDKKENQRLKEYRSINQVCKIGNLLEFPVVTVMKGNNGRKLDINSLPFDDLKEVIEQIKCLPNFPYISIMFHSFSFLDERGYSGTPILFSAKKRNCYGVRPDVKVQFEQLLDYIAQDDQLETATLRDCLEMGIGSAKMESDQMFFIDPQKTNSFTCPIQVAQKDNIFTISLQDSEPGDQYSWGIYNEKNQLRFESKLTSDSQFTYCARPNETVTISVFITDTSGKRFSNPVVIISEQNGIFELEHSDSSTHAGEEAVALPATPLLLRYRSDEISYSSDGALFTFFNERLEPETEYAFFVLNTENKVLEKTPFSTVPSATFTMNLYSGNVKIKAAAKYRGLQTSRIAAEVFCDPENHIYKIDPSYKNPKRNDCA